MPVDDLEERNKKVVLGQIAIEIKDEEGDGDNTDINSSESLTSKSESNDNDLLQAIDAEEIQ